MAQGVRQVGTPDAAAKNSPICTPAEKENLSVPEGTEPGNIACYFNDEAFPNGAEVATGNDVLRCSEGRWVKVEAADR